jgi:hypothetical protein
MAIDEKNGAPIYNVKTIEDVKTIPDENLREFAEDAMRLVISLFDKVGFLGIGFDGIRFQPNGLGEVSYNLKRDTTNGN